MTKKDPEKVEFSAMKEIYKLVQVRSLVLFIFVYKFLSKIFLNILML